MVISLAHFVLADYSQYLKDTSFYRSLGALVEHYDKQTYYLLSKPLPYSLSLFGFFLRKRSAFIERVGVIVIFKCFIGLRFGKSHGMRC